MKINLISNDNGWGLTKDIKILQNVFRNHDVFYSKYSDPPKGFFDLNVHIELVGSRYYRNAKRNWLIPNPEWFMSKWIRSARRFEYCLVKTQHGVKIFNDMGFNTKYVGFTSESHALGVPWSDKVKEFYHFAGNSLFKNTMFIVHNWLPRWPTLHVFGRNKLFESLPKKDNVIVRLNYLTDEEVVKVQNNYAYALQPSEAEGYGHCLGEPLSTGSVLITTDGSPMNEFPAYLVGAEHYDTHHYGPRYRLNQESFINTIEKVLVQDNEGFARIGQLWWANNKKNFENNIRKLL